MMIKYSNCCYRSQSGGVVDKEKISIGYDYVVREFVLGDNFSDVLWVH